MSIVQGSNGRSQPVVFSAYPVGYGPAAKALVLAADCRRRGVETVFVGDGVAYELVSRSSGVFDRVVHAGAAERTAQDVVAGAAVVVSVMDREFASLASDQGRPLHVVDSLLWMRSLVPESFLRARSYWAQDFVGVRDRASELTRPPTVVGPILDARRPRKHAQAVPKKLGVNLGGFAASDGADSLYGELVLRALTASRLYGAFPRERRILANAATIRQLAPLAAELGVQLTSLARDSALDELATASLVLTSPGLTTTLESFRFGRPTAFLPPQNFSQWCALKALRAHGLAPHALHWEDLGDSDRLGNATREPEVSTARVRATIARLAAASPAREALVDSLSSCATIDWPMMAARQQDFFRLLGPNGAPVIAAALVAELGA